MATAFERILQKWINIPANSNLGKYHETKMGEGTEKTISCSKV